MTDVYEDEKDTVINAPTTSPYSYRDFCKACGAGEGVSRHWDHFWRGSLSPVLDLSYCPGNQRPIEMRPVHGAPVFMMNDDGPSLAASPEREVKMDCAGITAKHLHVVCRHCGAAWLMDTYRSQRNIPLLYIYVIVGSVLFSQALAWGIHKLVLMVHK